MRSNTPALAFALSALVFACSGNSTSEPDGEVANETSLDEPEQSPNPIAAPVGDDNGDAGDGNPGPAVEGSPSAEPDPALEDCTYGEGLDERLAAPSASLPTALSGTLCDVRDSLWSVIEPAPGAPIRVRLRSGDGPYTLSVFKSVDGVVEPLPTERDSHVFTLSATEPEAAFADRFGTFVPTPRLGLQLQGPPGAIEVEFEELVLAPLTDCNPTYEGTPITTTPSALPATFEADLCSARDSRVRAFEVVAGRPVTVTLENPYSMEAARTSVVHADVFYTLLPVTAGTNESTLGLFAHSTMTFTPEESGAVALYLSGTLSRGEPMRLRVEQE